MFKDGEIIVPWGAFYKQEKPLDENLIHVIEKTKNGVKYSTYRKTDKSPSIMSRLRSLANSLGKMLLQALQRIIVWG